MRDRSKGGTDVMVELNFDLYRPGYLLDLTLVGELAEWPPDNGRIWLGAGVTYTRVQTELGGWLPGLAMASAPSGHRRSATGGRSAGNAGPRPRRAMRFPRRRPRTRRWRPGRCAARG